MPVRAFIRTDLALAQLETALQLYFGGTDYASVITLAGAADEIFGQRLTASGRESSLYSLKKAVGEIHQVLYGEATAPKQIADRANFARNSLKHWKMGDSDIVKFDIQQEANDMLNRAIDNYWQLEAKLSVAMEEFQRANMAA